MEKKLEVYTQLERLIAQTEDQFQQIEKSGKLVDLCVAFFHFCETYQQIDGLRKRLYHLLDSLDKVVIPTTMQAQGVEKLSVAEVEHSFYILPKYSASVLDKEAAYKWLRKNGMSELITETVNSGTLAARLVEMVLQEAKDPPECIDFKTYNITGMSKYTPKPEPKTKQAKKERK